MRYTVTAPNAEFTGEIGGVAFYHGAATVESEQASTLGYFRRRGFTLTPAEGEPQQSTPPPRPAKTAAKSSWVAYVAATTDLSEEEARALSKDDLVDLASGEASDE
jgi:hypothetical protein